MYFKTKWVEVHENFAVFRHFSTLVLTYLKLRGSPTFPACTSKVCHPLPRSPHLTALQFLQEEGTARFSLQLLQRPSPWEPARPPHFLERTESFACHLCALLSGVQTPRRRSTRSSLTRSGY